MNTISDIFKYADAPVLTVEAEVALIDEAQAGNEESFLALAHAYGPTLRASVGKAKKTNDREEVEAEALAAFAEVVYTHDAHDENYANGRLASRLTPHLRDRLGEAQTQRATVFTIPKRTYTRYYGILNAADGDFEAALALAPSMAMKASTFAEVHGMVQEASSLTHDDEDSDGEEHYARPVLNITERDFYCEAEDAVMVEVAFAAVEDEQARIMELAYGFTEYEPVSDAEIAHRLGNQTRPTIQRKRVAALASMRKALGVTLD